MTTQAKRSTLKNRADRLFSQFIRDRDKVCQACGSPENGQCAHLLSRRYHSTRWSPDNAVRLCRDCHVRYTHNPLLWDMWIQVHLGGYEAFHALRCRALEPWDKDINAVLDRLDRERGLA